MQNLTNINPNDFNKITGTKRISFGTYLYNDMLFDMYIIKFNYADGTSKFIRVFCDGGTSQMLANDRQKNEFFINRLFGANGLMVKEGRNDYIYLGGVYDNGRRTTRFNKSNSGKTMQEEFDNYFKNVILPMLTMKSDSADYNLIDMVYHFHTGNEDMHDVFQNGLLSRFGTSLTSTFYPTHSNIYSVINNLEDAVKTYGEVTSNIGRKVFVTRIPAGYRGEKNASGMYCPPMPIMKMVDASNGLSIIIPEIIYGMYDTENGVFYKNPNYKPKYNPNGLTYDEETIRIIDGYHIAESEEMVKFMRSRNGYNYDQLKKFDDKYGTFNQYCQVYGIKSNSTYENSGKKGRR